MNTVKTNAVESRRRAKAIHKVEKERAFEAPKWHQKPRRFMV